MHNAFEFIHFSCHIVSEIHCRNGGWSGGAMVLGKLQVPGRPSYLDKGRARAYYA